jgi:hypothetical protein
MKIRYSEFHPDPSLRNVINDTLPRHRALAAIDSGLATEIPYASAQERLRSETPWAFESVTATVQWSNCRSAARGLHYIAAKCSRPNCTQLQYDGAPSAALESLTFNHSCGCQNSERIPAAVAAQYRSAFKPATQLGKDEAIAATLGRPQPSRPVDLTKCTGPTTGPERPGDEKSGLLNYLPNKGDGQHAEPASYMRPVKG